MQGGLNTPQELQWYEVQYTVFSVSNYISEIENIEYIIFTAV